MRGIARGLTNFKYCPQDSVCICSAVELRLFEETVETVNGRYVREFTQLKLGVNESYGSNGINGSVGIVEIVVELSELVFGISVGMLEAQPQKC